MRTLMDIQLYRAETLGKLAFLEARKRNPLADKKMRDMALEINTENKPAIFEAWLKGWDTLFNIKS
jgi:hypothetical protein